MSSCASAASTSTLDWDHNNYLDLGKPKHG